MLSVGQRGKEMAQKMGKKGDVSPKRLEGNLQENQGGQSEDES